jgi:hypothetical protein
VLERDQTNIQKSMSSTPQESDDDGSDEHTEDDVDSDGSMEHLTEDINTLSVNAPTGFMGRGSEVAWLRILHAELDIERDEKSKNEMNDIFNFSGSVEGVGSKNRNIRSCLICSEVPSDGI